MTLLQTVPLLQVVIFSVFFGNLSTVYIQMPGHMSPAHHLIYMYMNFWRQQKLLEKILNLPVTALWVCLSTLWCVKTLIQP